MSEVKVTKKELQDAARKAVIGKFDLTGATQVDTGSFVFEEGEQFVEVKFTVKSDKFDLAEAVSEYEEKCMKAQEREEEKAKKAAEKAAKKSE